MNHKKEKFVELANKRVNNALHHIKLIGNLSNKHSYDYTEDEVTQIMKALENGIAQTKKRFNEQKNKTSGFSITE